MFKKIGKNRQRDLYPDEIFLDSSNLPKFNLHQFEGRIEKPIGKRTVYMTFSLFLFISIVYFGQATLLQIVRGEDYFNISQNNHLELRPIFTDRGVIYDRNGVPLAWNEISDEPSDFALRKYIEKSGFGHLLGYVKYPAKDKNNIYYEDKFVARGGVEESFNAELSGKNGIHITEKNALLEVVSESVQLQPIDGDNVTLSIDSRIQSKLYETIVGTTRNGFRGGAGIMMNVRTGEIVAMTSYPEYSPQVMTDGDNVTEIRRLLSDNRQAFLDRSMAGLFTPGSIVKPFMAMAALSENTISPEKKILSTGALRVTNPYFPGRYTLFNDWKAHGWVDMRRAIAVSSNVYFFTIGGGFGDQKGLGIKNIEKYMRMFGLGKPAGVNIRGEKDGIIPSPDWKAKNFEDGTWYIGDTYNTSIGQYGFQVTPLSMLRALAGIANDGKLPTPTILKTDKESVMETLPLKKEHFKIVKEGMRLGAQEGTAAGLSVAYTKVAAKTGTAEIGATKAYVNSWVMGFFPYEKPEYAFIVLMERGPRANLVGGVSVMRQLLDYMRFNTPEYFGFAPLPPRSEIPIPDEPVETPAETPTEPPVITQPNEIDPLPEQSTNPPPAGEITPPPATEPTPPPPTPTPVGQ